MASERKFYCMFDNGLSAEATVNKTILLQQKSQTEYLKIEWTPAPPKSREESPAGYLEWMCDVKQAIANMLQEKILYVLPDPASGNLIILEFAPDGTGYEGEKTG